MDDVQAKVLQLLDVISIEVAAGRNDTAELRAELRSETTGIRKEMRAGFGRVDRRLGNLEPALKMWKPSFESSKPIFESSKPIFELSKPSFELSKPIFELSKPSFDHFEANSNAASHRSSVKQVKGPH